MKQINLRADQATIQLRKMEDAILRSEGNEEIVFIVDYISTARRIAKYAILHGYQVSVKQPACYEFIVTVYVDTVRKESLVDQVFAEIDPDQVSHPAYIRA